MKKFAISQNGQVNQRLVFDSKEKADESFWQMKPDNFENKIEVLPVWEFELWFRQYDDKDFILFYSDKENVDEAIEEAMKRLSPTFAIVMTEFGQVTNAKGRIENEKLNNYKNEKNENIS